MKRLNNKIAIITGAGHGIGEGIARMFAAQGSAVLLADKDEAAVKSVCRSIQLEDGVAEAVTADVSRTEDLRRMVEAAAERFGGLDILVNNAALTGFWYKLEDPEVESRYDDLMTTNVKSAWMSLHFAVPLLRSRGGGSVINIASVHGMASSTHNSAYAASKGALIAGARAMAIELAPDRIRVNCISPGMIWTADPADWHRKELGPELFQEFMARFGDWLKASRTMSQPLPVEGLPEDIAHCAVYLASDESRFCTGANFVVDGGATAHLSDPNPSQQTIELLERDREMYAWIAEAVRRRKGLTQ